MTHHSIPAPIPFCCAAYYAAKFLKMRRRAIIHFEEQWNSAFFRTRAVLTMLKGESVSDEVERLRVAQWVLERNLGWIAASEVKAGVVVAIDTAMFGALATAFSCRSSDLI